MTRLQTEFQRLYLPATVDAPATDHPLIDPHGQVRALVVELARPADWDALSAVWRGVQTELELPAPAIAVSGTEGFQLWFSLAEPVPAPQAHAFLEALRQRFLPDVPAHRLRLLPAPDAAPDRMDAHAARVPALQPTGNWSAFVAPDLAPVFADTPWLDIVPGEEGQAELLRRVSSIRTGEWAAAVAVLTPRSVGPAAASTAGDSANVPSSGAAASSGTDPRRFLQQVMNDERVPMALRIEAAKALLVHGDDRKGSSTG